MNYFKQCVEYIKDNPKGYWFKRKLYGWGWVPVKWQGWFAVAIFILFLVWNSLDLASKPVPTDAELLWFFVSIVLLVAALIFICYKTGEKPRWQWGFPVQNSDRETK